MQSVGVILLGEDIEDDALLFRMTIKRSGWDARVLVLDEAGDIRDYLSGAGKYQDRLSHPLPALIFLDGQLHHEPSMRLLRWMVEQPALKRIPIFLLSGSLNPKVCEEAKIIGARECFEKPFDEEHIRKVEEVVFEAA
jgi:CheY-like chemotaxis protein